MPIVLYRIDDRLIHGQVVVGWGRPLGVQRIVLVDDAVAASGWEQELYRMAVPPEIELLFTTTGEAREQLEQWRAATTRTLLLTGDVGTMVRLNAPDGAGVRDINLGGIHQGPGRRQLLPYLYLTDEELAALRALEAAGARVSAQDVPTAVPVALKDLS